MRINKPNPNWNVIQKDLKAINQLFNEVPGMTFYGKAFDAKNGECIFADSGVMVFKVKYTTRCTSEIKLLANIDGEDCWILPDERYRFDIEYEVEA